MKSYAKQNKCHQIVMTGDAYEEKKPKIIQLIKMYKLE